jgi:DNA-binding transcriptional regulator LsrR (DeoR family)
LGPGSSYDIATPYIRKYIQPTFRRQELIDAGAVAEINLFPFSSDGTPVPHRLATLCACLNLTRIQALSRDHQRDMVLIAGGRRKTNAILAALKGGYLNVLVTDTHSAREILAANSPEVP